ncbi:unnamed protein product [Symbiodinium natans]|uniref:Vacuolar ATPase assembly integral membrane protein VMA21 homolog n=1 Tax=Symbiodinium natans TaxID=878477 RepID=A0A812QAC4_9DINO|nr:unnamed protein product [Symbiodinium natans]
MADGAEGAAGKLGAESAAGSKEASSPDPPLNEGGDLHKDPDQAGETAPDKSADDAVADQPADKPTTLFQALGDQGNRDVAKHFASFSAALVTVPVLGLFGSEWALRSFVAESGSRWIYSGVVAVALVNVVLIAFVASCFAEGFPEAESKTSRSGQSAPGVAGEAEPLASADGDTKKSK